MAIYCFSTSHNRSYLTCDHRITSPTSVRFEQLNTSQKLRIFKFLFLFHFDIIFYSLTSRLLPAQPLFLIVLHYACILLYFDEALKKVLENRCRICARTIYSIWGKMFHWKSNLGWS